MAIVREFLGRTRDSGRRVAWLGGFVGFVLLACAALVLWQTGQQVQILRLELSGAHQLKRLNLLLLEVQSHRDQTAAFGPQAASVVSAAAAVDSAFEATATMLPEEILMGATWQDSRSEWTRLGSELAGLDAHQRYEQQTAVIERLSRVLVDMADQSQLTLSAQLDTFYLQDMLVNRLPALQEALSRLRALGTLALHEGRLRPATAEQIRSAMSEVETRLNVEQIGIERLLLAMPAEALTIDDAQAQLQLGVAAQMATLQREVLGGAYHIDPASFFAAASEQIRIGPALMDSVFHPELERSLQRSIDRAVRLAIAVGIALVLAIGSLLAVIRIEIRNSRALRLSSELNRQLIENAPLPLIVVDTTGCIRQFNAAAVRLFGYAASELFGKGIEILVPEAQRADHAKLREGFGRIGKGRAMAPGRELTARRKDGTFFPCEISLAAIHRDDMASTVASIFDLTRIREAEEQMRMVNEHLLSVAGERTTELISSRAELTQTVAELQLKEEALREAEKLAALGRTVASFAHDIATPVGNCNMAISTIADALNGIQRAVDSGKLHKSALLEFFEVVRQGSQLSLKNISRSRELLEAMKQTALDQATGAARVFVLDAWFRDLDVVLAPMVKGTPHQLVKQIAAGLEISSYPGPLGQVITNLVSNALVHAFDDASPGCITVIAERKDQGVCITVRDNGRGMSPEVAARVFEPFFTTRAGSGGTGLGMHIVQSTVEGQLGGHLKVHTAPGAGTEICIELPESALVAERS